MIRVKSFKQGYFLFACFFGLLHYMEFLMQSHKSDFLFPSMEILLEETRASVGQLYLHNSVIAQEKKGLASSIIILL